DELQALKGEQREDILLWYKRRLSEGGGISPLDNKEYPFYDYLVMMGYDDSSLRESLEIYRNGESDYVNVEFVSEDPELSAFIVNVLSREFIQYYHNTTSASQQNT